MKKRVYSSRNNLLSLLSCLKKAAAMTMFAFSAANVNSFAQGRYYTGDFHNHTTYTDGSFTIGYVLESANKFKLDWWANSEHGGSFNRWGWANGQDFGTFVTWDNTGYAIKGNNLSGNNMWRWQSISEFSFRDILLYRRVFPNKIIVQGYEGNAPGHEHMSIGVIGNQFSSVNPDVNALSQFEYLFDANDRDDSQPLGVTIQKNHTNNHGKCIEAVKWLQTNHPTDSWFVPAHPERYVYNGSTGWNIEHFRDLNNVGPDVFFGFESIPGHHSAANRGEYAASRPSVGMGTYGGAGIFTAKVGGLWDALLSEGRRFWVFASSDFHNTQGDFHPGEYQKTYTYMTSFTPQGIVDGLRSGNSYVVHGDLIDTLQFKIGNAMMGQTHRLSGNQQITVTVRLRVPDRNNNTYGGSNVPYLDHFDLIAGEITSKATPPATYPIDGVTGYSSAYKLDTVSTTKVIARFGRKAAGADPCGISTIAWTEESGGFINVSYNYTVPQGKKMYFRLRGTNHPLNTPNETDACGNPLCDTLLNPNNHQKAFADLWFYTNPVFVEPSTAGKVESNYTVPSWTLYQRELVAGKFESDAAQKLVSKDNPFNINTTINGDPRYQIGATWFSNAGATGGKLQVKAGNTTDFSGAREINATSLAINDLIYIANSNNNNQISEASGFPKETKRSYLSNKVLIDNLQPNTTYSYRVGGINGIWSEVGTFTTAKNNKDEFEFIYITDTQANTDDMFNVSKRTVEAARTMLPNAKFLLCAGDFVETYHIPAYEHLGYTGSAEWEWEQWFEKMQSTWLKLPIVPIQGNHDISPTSNMFHHFNTDVSYNASQSKSAAKTNMDGTVYSFKYGDALFMVLSFENIPLPYVANDDNETYINAIADWLRAEVDANKDVKWRIVAYHKSMFTGSTAHQDDQDGRFVREKIAPVLQEIGVDLTLQGHDHIYEVIGVIVSGKNGSLNTYQYLPNTASDQTFVAPTFADGTVNCVPSVSVTGKNGGTFDVSQGTIYFLNNSAGKKKYYPRSEAQMRAAENIHQIPNYYQFFNRFGQTGEPTFSSVKVSTDAIRIATYTVNDAGVPALFDEFKIVKGHSGGIINVEDDVIQIYPNPTSDIFYIEGADISKVSIYNTIGKLVKIDNVSENSFNIRELPAGVYSIKLETIAKKIIYKTIVKK